MNLALNSDGDLDSENGNTTFVDGIDAIKQNLSMRLKTFLGEQFQDETRGVPWWTDILIKNPSFLVIGELLKATILETQGVTDIISFVFDLEGRIATLEFEALTINGFINFSEKIGV